MLLCHRGSSEVIRLGCHWKLEVLDSKKTAQVDRQPTETTSGRLCSSLLYTDRQPMAIVKPGFSRSEVAS
jgi:hypothetical protein